MNDIPFLWFQQHLVDGLLPRWHAAAVTNSGFFYVNLDRDWSRLPENVGTLVSQARSLYVFSVGYMLTRKPAYRKAVEVGARFLLAHFADIEHGGYVWACDSEGEILDATKDAYGHAFALLGLVYAYRILGDPALREAAWRVFDLVRANFRDAQGGLVWKLERDWSPLDDVQPRSQNPMMHTFESFVAFAEVLDETGVEDGPLTSRDVLAEAEAIAQFLFLRRSEAEAVPLLEVYAPDWTLLDADARFFSIGHQFEWAFLLSYAVERGLPERFLELGRRCLDVGLRYGCEARGAIRAFANPEGQITRENLTYWDHTEALRALMHFVVRRGESRYLEPLRRILVFTQAHVLDTEHGGWYASLDATGAPLSMGKGSVWKVDYHPTALCLEAIRLQKP